MADAYLGKSAVFKIGPSSANVTISGGDNGLSNVQISQEPTIRAVPGGGSAVTRQNIGILDNTISFEVDANSVTWPVLFMKTGTKIHFEYSPRGTASSTPKLTGQAFITVTHPVPTDDVQRFTVEGMVDGVVTVGTN